MRRHASIRPTAVACLVACAFAASRPAYAGQAAFDGPPPPVAPETISRNASGQVTVRAIRLTAPLRVDGRLDEAVYAASLPMSDFIQTEPQEGAPATEKTEVWVLFDQDNIYVAARCWETSPERMLVNVMQRDSPTLMQNENFGVMFDPFHDRRNAVMFMLNPIGGRTDTQVIDRQSNRDWNPVWEFKTGRFEGGWTVEIAIPFKSLRYRPGRSQVWGFNARRIDRWKNETSHLTPIPNTMTGSGLFQPQLGATMVGLEAPSGSKNLEIKPYAISNLSTNRTATPAISNDVSGDFGVDAKYGVTQNLTADLTYNTDFAQVEADEQQVNLTRFSLFFPEKREFFLENLGLFGFGGASATSASGNVPILFYSRRIGLNQARGSVIPIELGGRMTGRLGRYGVGVLNIETDEESVSATPRTNFSVVRVKRDVLRKSSIGLIYAGRSVGQSGPGRNDTYGVDGTFLFFQNLAVNTYWAQTRTEHVSGDDVSYRAQLDYRGDRYGVQAERLVVGSQFSPEVGFVRRADMHLTSGLVRFSPRPAHNKTIRRLSWTGSGSYIENGAGQLETRNWDGEFSIEFQNSDKFIAGYSSNYDAPKRAFTIGPGVRVPVGAYDYSSWRTGFNFGPQRRISGNVLIDSGTFYGGDKTALTFTSARATLSPRLSVEPSYSINWVDLPQRKFTTHLAGSRITFTVTPLMFTSALVQYNSDVKALTANIRLRWEYRPGSELFVVYNEQRDTGAAGFPALANRAFIVKINRLFRS